MRRCFLWLCVVGVSASVPSWAQSPKSAAAEAQGWQSLFDGKTLKGWKSTKFGGEGEVSVADGNLILDRGSSLTGANYTGEVPTTNFEVSLEAKRVEGHDFFVGLTFPVAKSHCSLIVGGWAGSIVGLSCIDGYDASENNTTTVMKFDNNKWYKFRVRVTPEKIQSWINDDLIIDQSIVDKKINVRAEVELSRPFGLATYETKAAIRNIQLRKLPATPDKGKGKDQEKTP